MLDLDFTGQIVTLRRRCLEATQSLLGDTIGLSDDEWRQPSLLPGWSRAHVAAHLTANALALRGVVVGATLQQSVPLYPSADEKYRAIQRGAERDPLQLQISLDTSAGELDVALDSITDWSAIVHLAGRRYPLSSIPLLRLREIYLHHLDLATGFSVTDITPVPARWLLELALSQFADRADLPSVIVSSDSGVVETIGRIGVQRTVSGSDARLWGWLLGRVSGESVDGADGLAFPLAQ